MRLIWFILDMVASLLPPRYRRWAMDPVRGAVYSGIFQTLSALVFYVYSYIQFMKAWGRLASGAMSSQAAVGQGAEQLGMALGAVGYVSFAVSPAGIAAMYFMIEGFVRCMAAGIVGEPTASLPFWLVGRAHDAAERRIEKYREAPPQPDSVLLGQPGDPWDLRIASAHRKEGWRPPVQIEYAGVIYAIAQVFEEPAGERTNFVYALKRAGEIGAFRGLIHYDPFEYWKNLGDQ